MSEPRDDRTGGHVISTTPADIPRRSERQALPPVREAIIRVSPPFARDFVEAVGPSVSLAPITDARECTARKYREVWPFNSVAILLDSIFCREGILRHLDSSKCRQRPYRPRLLDCKRSANRSIYRCTDSPPLTSDHPTARSCCGGKVLLIFAATMGGASK